MSKRTKILGFLTFLVVIASVCASTMPNAKKPQNSTSRHIPSMAELNRMQAQSEKQSAEFCKTIGTIDTELDKLDRKCDTLLARTKKLQAGVERTEKVIAEIEEIRRGYNKENR